MLSPSPCTHRPGIQGHKGDLSATVIPSGLQQQEVLPQPGCYEQHSPSVSVANSRQWLLAPGALVGARRCSAARQSSRDRGGCPRALRAQPSSRAKAWDSVFSLKLFAFLCSSPCSAARPVLQPPRSHLLKAFFQRLRTKEG